MNFFLTFFIKLKLFATKFRLNKLRNFKPATSLRLDKQFKYDSVGCYAKGFAVVNSMPRSTRPAINNFFNIKNVLVLVPFKNIRFFRKFPMFLIVFFFILILIEPIGKSNLPLPENAQAPVYLDFH